jgi:hypothetical protein
MGPAFGDGVVALARVVGPVGGDACDLLIGTDLAEQLRQHGRLAHVAPGDLDRPDLQRLLINPDVDLAPDAAPGAAMLAPSPSTLIPVLSIKRCSGPCDPRCGILTARVFWRRLRVLESGTSQSRPISRNRLSTNPVVCRVDTVIRTMYGWLPRGKGAMIFWLFVGCGHVFGVSFAVCPRALMNVRMRSGPYQWHALYALWSERGAPSSFPSVCHHLTLPSPFRSGQVWPEVDCVTRPARLRLFSALPRRPAPCG